MVRVIALVAALLITAAACGGSPDDVAAPPDSAPDGQSEAQSEAQSDGPSKAPSESPPDDTTGNEPVPAKLKFTSADLDGAAFKGESVAGKPVVLWFWAPWCTKCAAEAPAVKRAAAEHGDSVAFLGVPGQSDKPAMRRFVARHGLSGFPQLPDERLWRRFGVTQTSSFVFMKPDGATTDAAGPLGDDDLARHIQDILK